MLVLDWFWGWLFGTPTLPLITVKTRTDQSEFDAPLHFASRSAEATRFEFD